MAVIYKCDHCDTVLNENEKRSTTIGSRSFELCPLHKEEFERLVREFFHLHDTKPIMGGIIRKQL